MRIDITPGTLFLDRDSASARVAVNGVEKDVKIKLEGELLTLGNLRLRLWEEHQGGDAKSA